MLWGFLVSQPFTAVNASLLLLGRVKVLETNFSRALQGLSQRQCNGEEWAGTWFCTSGAGSSETMQLIGDPEKPSLFSEGPLHCRLKECCCERSGAVMSLAALCFPKLLRRYSTSSRVSHMMSMGKAPSFSCP